MEYRINDVVVFSNELVTANSAPKPRDGELLIQTWARDLIMLGYSLDGQYLVVAVRANSATDIAKGSVSHPQLLTLLRMSDSRVMDSPVSGEWITLVLRGAA